MNREEASAILRDMKEALAAVGEQHGVRFEFGTGRFDAASLKLRVEARTTNEDILRGRFVHDAYAVAARSQIAPDEITGWWQKEFASRDGMMRVVGINDRRKYCITCEDEKGKLVYFSPAGVQRLINRVTVD